MRNFIVTLFLSFFSFIAIAGGTTAAPSGPVVPNQPKDTSVFKDTDGKCYSRVAKTFGKEVLCPAEKPASAPKK